MKEFVGLVLAAMGVLICAWMMLWLCLAVFTTTQLGLGWLAFVPTALIGLPVGAAFYVAGRRLSSA